MRGSLMFLLLALAPAPPLAAQAGTDWYTDWYVVTIDGSPVGWMCESRSAAGPDVRVRGRMYMALNRLGSQVVMEISQASTESASGALRSVDVDTRMSREAVSTAVAVSGLRATVTTSAGGRRFERTLDLTDTLLGPVGARRLSVARLREAGDSVRYVTWDAQLNAPATVTRVVLGRDSLLRVVERSSASPVVTTIWMDASGRAVRAQFDLPFGRAAVALSDSATAIGTGGGTLAEESYARTLVRTGIKLPRAREIDYLRLSLAVDSAAEMPDLSGPGQRVLVREPGRVVLEVTRRAPPRRRAAFPVAVSPAAREYLEPNAYIQSDEPRLRETARRVVGAERDPMAAALGLQRWVAENMALDLGVAFAPSVEVLERKRGTCVAYATLLAALTRAVGIPSRIAMGYVYVNGVLGGHAWTEVLVGDEWIPIDAALVADGPADAARFAFARSSLAGGPGSLMSGAAARLYGRVRASVLAYGIAGVRREVPAGADAYVVAGDRYRNPWLGVELTKPSGFRFAQLDETWPASTILALTRGRDSVRVLSRLRHPWLGTAEHARRELARDGGSARAVQVAGRMGWRRDAAGRAAMAIPVGLETLVIEASDSRLLSRVAATLRLRPW